MIEDKTRIDEKVISHIGSESISHTIENVNSIKNMNLFSIFARIDAHNIQYPSAIAAADVFVYVGNLSPILNKTSRVLRKNDIFIFTVEEKINVDSSDEVDDDGWILQLSGRFAHRESYIRTVVKEDCEDLKIVSLKRITPRYENGQPIKGLLVTLVKEGS